MNEKDYLPRTVRANTSVSNIGRGMNGIADSVRAIREDYMSTNAPSRGAANNTAGGTGNVTAKATVSSTDNAPVDSGDPGAENPDEMIPEESEDYSGFLRVQVYTASGAYPVPNALVTVSSPARGLITAAVTQSGGQTDLITLPAPAPSESFRPGVGVPYELYTIDTSAPGYYGVKNLGVAVYPGITTVQRVELIPVSAIGGGDVIIDTKRTDL